MTQPFTYQKPVTDVTGQAVLDNQGNSKTTSVRITEQIIPMGPVASQVAIKQLGTNGGGFLIPIRLIRLKTLIHSPIFWKW